MYDLTYNSGYRCLFELDVRQLLQKYWEQKEISSSTALKGPSFISSQPSWQKEKIADDEQESVAALEPGTSVLGIFFIRNPDQQPSAKLNDMGIREVLCGSQIGAAME